MKTLIGATAVLLTGAALALFKFAPGNHWIGGAAAVMCVAALILAGTWLMLDNIGRSEGDPEEDPEAGTSSSEGGECAAYRLATERVFGAFFRAHGFKPAGSPTLQSNDREAGGPHCVWFYESPDCRFKFKRDGVVSLYVGKPTAPLNGLHENQGWHIVTGLIPRRAGPGPLVKWNQYEDAELKQVLWHVEHFYPDLLDALDKAEAS